MDRLAGKACIVTGGGSGIGRAAAMAFVREGGRVMIVDRDFAAAESVAGEIRATGSRANAMGVDVSDSEQVRNMVHMTQSLFGRIDVLFNNAGVEGPNRPTAEYGESDWHEVIAVNLTGVFYGLEHTLPVMVQQESGVVINTASVAGLVGLSGAAAYSAAKGGVIALTRTVALEYARFGIRVNCICPGFVETPMLDRVLEGRPPAAAVAVTPQKRLGTPDDVANAAVFLACDESAFTTGSPLIVDGGYIAR